MTEIESFDRAQIDQIAARADRNCHAHISHALRLKAAEDFARFVATIGGITVLVGSAVLLGRATATPSAEITVAIAGALITLVGVWEAVWQPGSRAKNHKQWAEEYAAIENQCRLALREHNSNELEALLRAMLEAGRSADLIPTRHWKAGRQQRAGRDSSYKRDAIALGPLA